MGERLDLIKLAPSRVLDAGCGTGADLPLLAARYSGARIVGLDSSLPMLGQAQSTQQANQGRFARFLENLPGLGRGRASDGATMLIAADFGRLPLAHQSVELVWSNLALHWHPQAHEVFREWHRTLKVDGVVMFSVLGPDTFKELRAAFACVDQAPHTLPFVDMHDFGDMLVAAGFSTPVMDMEVVTVTYESVDRLIADVRAWGGNPLETRRKGLMSRAAGKAFRDALEAQRQVDGSISLTYEIIYGHAFRAPARTTSAGDAIVRFMPKGTKP